MSPTYAASEESRQAGATLELYRVRVGAMRGRPGSPTTFDEVEALRDEFEYADTAALLAAWTFDPHDFPASECVLDPTGGEAGTKALRINVPAGEQDGPAGPQARRRLTGLVPNTWHDLSIQVKLDATFATDPLTPFYSIIGLRAGGLEVTSFLPYGTYVTATARGRSSATGTLDVWFGWQSLAYSQVQVSHSLWWDDLVVTRLEEIPVATDGFEYATLGALDAAWPKTDTMGGPTIWSIDTVVVVEGTYAAKGEFPYVGGPGDSYRTRTFTGLAPNTPHAVRIRMWISSEQNGSIGVATGLEIVGGGSQYSEASGPINAWVTLEAQGISNGAGDLTVRAGWFHSQSGSWDPRTIRLDDLKIFEVVDVGEPSSSGVASHFTSADVNVVYGEATYLSGIIVRNNLTAGGNEASAGNIELSVPRTHPIAALAAGPPNPPVSLELIRLHRADLTQAVTPWRGQVVRRRFQGAECILICAGIGSLLARKLPRRMTQRSCMHILYDSLCQASRAAFTSELLTVSAIDGVSVTVDGAAAAAGTTPHRWQNGVLLAPDGVRGRIESFDAGAGDVVILRQTLPTLQVNDEVRLIAGCDNQIETCKAVFDNTRNFGGERVLPVRDPGTGAGIGTSGGDA